MLCETIEDYSMRHFMLNLKNNYLVMFFILSVSSCASDPNRIPENMPVDEIIKLANNSLVKKNYGRAADFFMEVNQFYPYSDEARNSLIEAAKAYHANSDLSNARLAAQEYLLIYSNNSDAPFAKYMIGLSYFDAIVDVNRDQGAALDALREFEELIETYPDSQYVDMATKKFNLARAQLAGQEMTVGRFYLHREKYLAAISRFEMVVKTYPQTPYFVEALYRLIEANLSIGISKKAKENLKILQKRFPKSHWTTDAEELMNVVLQKDI